VSRHPDRVPTALPGVSTRSREPGYRVEDWTWEARRVRSSVQEKLRSKMGAMGRERDHAAD